jgi:hypothetical protein
MNQPLPPTEQAKVFFFWVGLILLIGAGGIGVLLILITLWGLYRMRSTQDFSYMETVRIIHKVFAAIASLGLTLLFIVNWTQFHLFILVLPLFIYPVYCLLLNTLFYVPLSKHKEWVVANGIFSTNPVETKYARTAPWISFGKSASIADELLKLNNLKEANLITLAEFDALRSKLLR